MDCIAPASFTHTRPITQVDSHENGLHCACEFYTHADNWEASCQECQPNDLALLALLEPIWHSCNLFAFRLLLDLDGNRVAGQALGVNDDAVRRLQT